MDEKQYELLLSKGYSNGYLLSRFEPELYTKIVSGCDESKPYFAGMIMGQKAAEREMFLENLTNTRKINEQLKPKMK